MADNKDCLTCPACGHEMDKKYIESMQKNIDICLEGCGGIFFDNREFEKIDEQHENIEEILSLVENKEFQQVDDKETRTCPYCHANMVKTNIFGVLIDTCYTCGGKFLDNNELTQYRNQYPSDVERSKVFNAMLRESIVKEGLPDLEIKNETEVVYSEPPMNPFKKFITNLFK